MDSERIQEIFEEMSDLDHKFDEIPDSERLHPSRRLCGYLKISALLQDPASFDVCAEHDVVWMNCSNDLRDDITREDIEYLSKCGVFWDEENDCFSHLC